MMFRNQQFRIDEFRNCRLRNIMVSKYLSFELHVRSHPSACHFVPTSTYRITALKMSSFRRNQQSFRRNQHVENFQLGNLFTCGDMTEVWGATRNSSGERVAIKIHDDEAALKHEVDILKELQGVYTPKFLDCGVFQGKAYFAMECFSATLDEFLQKTDENRYSCENIVLITCQAITGVQYLHKKHILHSDISPSHLMISFPMGSERNVLVKFVGLEKAKKFELSEGKVVPLDVNLEDVNKKWATAHMLSTGSVKPIDDIYQIVLMLWSMNGVSLEEFETQDGGFEKKLDLAIAPMKALPRTIRWMSAFFSSLDSFDSDALPDYTKMQKALVSCLRDFSRTTQLHLTDVEGCLIIQ